MCTGATGHVEVYDFTFEGGEKAYEDLVKHFFMFHDPTTLNRQGNDRGTQYASAIFTYDEKQVRRPQHTLENQLLYVIPSLLFGLLLQKEIATKVKAELQALVKKGKIPGYQSVDVVTYITDATVFYPAHDEHQEYLEKNPLGYCNHGYR